MSEQWEYKVVRVPKARPRSRQRTLNRLARQGWELDETKRAPFLSGYDQVTFRRPKAARPTREPAPEVPVSSGPHRHEFEDVTSVDDARNGIRFYQCSCGQARTVSV